MTPARRCIVAPMAAALLAVLGAGADTTVTLVADRDGTLFQPQKGESASGAGADLFVGRVNATGGGTRRRGLLHFPVESIPCGSVILTAECTLVPTGGQAAAQPLSLHRCTAAWGEGASVGSGGGGAAPEPGDATWTQRFWPDIPWSAAGGDFEPLASASASSAVDLPVTFGGAGLASDVQAWIDDPSSNDGWIVIGNEQTIQTTRRLASREAEDERLRPRLVVTFVPPPPADLDCDGRVDGSDLGTLLGLWGACPSPCQADFNGDGAVDGDDLGALLGDWSP